MPSIFSHSLIPREQRQHTSTNVGYGRLGTTRGSLILDIPSKKHLIRYFKMHPKFIALTLGSICGVFATLPRTFELLAFENGQRIGCINGYGNFITGSLACYPFNTVGTPVENVAIRGYEPCSASNGSLVCYQAAGPSSLFGVSQRFMCLNSL